MEGKMNGGGLLHIIGLLHDIQKFVDSFSIRALGCQTGGLYSHDSGRFEYLLEGRSTAGREQEARVAILIRRTNGCPSYVPPDYAKDFQGL